MKKIIVTVGIVIAVGLLALGAWYLFGSRNGSLGSPAGSGGSLPVVAQSGASVPVRHIASSQDPEVAKAFSSQMPGADQMGLGGTVVASPFALQIWGSTNGEGEALLENIPSTGWTMISGGGGDWSVFGLMEDGVPLSTAEQLIAGVTGAMSAPSSTTENVPLGTTIAIGTPNGSVTVNNFYKNADYIAEEQRAVIIQQTSTYSIVYNIQDSGFLITIVSPEFTTARQSAETAFLSDLNISNQDACKLSVHETVPGGMYSQYAGESFLLSFCSTPIGQ